MIKKEELAINGGDPVIKKNFPPYNTIGEEEKSAALKVLDSGVLSGFVGASGNGFNGGQEIQNLEKEVSNYFNVKHCIALNSWTSGLIAAVGAIDIEPGDEIIVTPWTMVATATAILHWNAIPVFVDIDQFTFNINPQKIEKAITSKTKAILYADIFGQSGDIDKIMNIAQKNNLKVISDTAQSPGALYKGKFAGTLADIGGFSLNYHKHIHCGEGGLVVTNSDYLAYRVKLIRNHGEAVIKTNKAKDLANIIGHNFRLGEIEAAIARQQLKKLKQFISTRQKAAERLREGLKGLNGLKLPFIPNNYTHVYYVFGIILSSKSISKRRNLIANALKAEGVPALGIGYQNIHLNPIFINRIAYGTKSFPWIGLNRGDSEVNYHNGLCPVAEKLHNETFLGIGLCHHSYTDKEIDLIIECFHKVWSGLNL
tara:strand:+ start:13325 stop:14605 length:1281 start_codon:yes stop_codon:yes gene_type:complete